jgi:acyl-coenzyme A thioesterase PaaI-like protein
LKNKLYIWVYRIAVNFWPCIWSTGGKVIELTPDFRRATVRLKLMWRTRNVVGTIFGGSIYASTDPIYMLMLMKVLGNNYIVWDKGCTIRFKKPAEKPIFARFLITDEMLKDVQDTVSQKGEYTFTWMIQYKDKDDVLYAELDKVMYVAKKEFYKEKLRKRSSS